MPAHTQPPRVLIIGGGYAGVTAANRLRRSAQSPEITVITGAPHFVERIRLHQVAAGTGGATRPFSDVLHPSVEVVPWTAVAIDAARREVRLDDGSRRAYDWLIYAVGSGAGAAPARGNIHRIDTLAGATHLATTLRARPNAAVYVVGGGLTAIEIASELAGTASGRGANRRGAAPREVTLIAAERSDVAGRTIQDHCLPWLCDEGCAVDRRTSHADLGDLPADGTLTIDATGFSTPDLARASGLDVDASGRLRVDRHLVSLSDPRILGAGDAVTVDGTPLAMSCQTAMPLGATAADVITARMAGERAAAISVRSRALCVSLGRQSGFVLPLSTGEAPRSWHLAGRTGAVAKELVCRYTVWAMRSEMRHPGSYRWGASA